MMNTLKILPIFLILTCWTPISLQANTPSSEQLFQAERLFDEECLEPALELYEKLLKHTEMNDPQIEKKVRYRVALCSYLLGDTRRTFDALKPLLEEPNLLYNDSLYLQALAYKSVGDWKESAKHLDSYITIESKTGNVPCEILLNRAEIACQMGDFPAAKQIIEKVQKEKLSPNAFAKTNLILAKIHHANENTHESILILDELIKQSLSHTPTYFESQFLLGTIYLQLNKPKMALLHFDSSVPEISTYPVPWNEDVLSKIGHAHLALAQQAEHLETKTKHYKNSEEVFRKLTRISPSENSLLTLAELLFEKGKILNDDSSLKEVETLLTASPHLLSREGLRKSLLLRSRATNDYAFRERLLNELTHESNHESALYWVGWMERCQNHFQEGANQGAPFYILAANEAHTFAELAKQFEPRFLEKALIIEAKSHLGVGTEESCLNGFQITNALLEQKSCEEEVFYLNGQIAYALSKLTDEQSSYLSIAEKSWKKCVEKNPDSPSSEQALFDLAALYIEKEAFEEGKTCLLNFATLSPTSPLAGKALFFAAKCAEGGHCPLQQVQEIKKQLIETHPNSPFAKEAFFTFYPYAHYLKQPQTLGHLEKLTKKYPNSHWAIYAQFLIGLDALKKGIEESSNALLIQAIEAFDSLETTFDTLWKKEQIPPAHKTRLIAIRSKSTLERANANLTIASRSTGAKKRIYAEYAIELLKNMTEELGSPSSSFATLPYPTQRSLMNESKLGWAHGLLINGKSKEARQTLRSIIEESEKNKTTKSWALATAWHEQAKIAYASDEFELALDAVKHAKEAAKGGLLSANEKLSIQITESLCHRKKGALGESMRILSGIVNERVISQKRLQAMYLRAEIYEEQKRPELAKRQLQALAKKGGKWAKFAQEKLLKDYTYESNPSL